MPIKNKRRKDAGLDLVQQSIIQFRPFDPTECIQPNRASSTQDIITTSHTGSTQHCTQHILLLHATAAHRQRPESKALSAINNRLYFDTIMSSSKPELKCTTL
jgi:hypothetical protein